MSKKNNKTKIKVNQVEIGFTKKCITAYGGISLLSAFISRINFREFIENLIPFKETSNNSKGIFSKIILFCLTVFAGGKKFEHMLYLGESEEIIKKIFNIDKIIKSSTSITRFFNKIKSWQKLEESSEKIREYILKIITLKGSISDYVTFDSTVLTRYGNQEGAFIGYNPQKRGRKSHHPIIAFLNGSKYILNLWNRSGKSNSANNIIEFTRQTFSFIRDKINVLGVLADSSFYNINFVKYLEEELNQKYVIAVKFYRCIQYKVLDFDLKWRNVDKDIDVAEFFFKHADENWDKERRYFAIRKKFEEKNKKETIGKQLSLFPEFDICLNYKYAVYMTNCDNDIVELWRLYRKRANDENRIKELKEDFGINTFNLKNFYSTEFVMLLIITFYNVYNLFRLEILSKKESNKRLSFFRYKYLVIPGISGKRGNQDILRLGIKSKSIRAKFEYLFSFISQSFSPFESQTQCT